MIDAEGAAWDSFAEDIVEGFEAVVDAERDALAELSAAELEAWNNAAADATASLDAEIAA